MKIDILNIKGEKVSSYDLPKEIFGMNTYEGLIHQALVLQLSNARQGTAKTKTRGEVSGGGKKPWKQKGTGRARTGSSRNPVWRGGGIIFGPNGEQNYKKDMPKKQRRKALFSMLSTKVRENNVFALEELALKEPKTKIVVEMINKLPVKRNALLVIPEENAVIEKACNNISSFKVIQANYLNIQDLLKYETVIFLKSALDKTEKIWLEHAKEIWKSTDECTTQKVIKKSSDKEEVSRKEEKVEKVVKKAVLKKKDTEVVEKKTKKDDTVKDSKPKKTAVKKTVAKKIKP